MFMTGIGSGIDFDSMIQVIIAAERAPKDNQLNRQEGMNTAEMEALEEIQSALNGFRDTVEDLNSSRELEKLMASVSNEDILSAVVDADAVPGEYTFEVLKLAQARRDQLVKIGEDDFLTSGTISFESGGKQVDIDIAQLRQDLLAEQQGKKAELNASTLEDVAEEHGYDLSDPAQKAEAQKALSDPSHPNFDQDRFDTYKGRWQSIDGEIQRLTNDGVSIEEVQGAINNHPNNDGVKANLIRTGGEISLVLNAKDTGVENSYSGLSVSGVNTNNGAPIGLVEPFQAAQDAEVQYGSMVLTSGTNKMDNVIEGITLNLKETGTTTVTVERDQGSVKDTISSFVESYNKVVETVNTYTKSSEDEAAALSGDAAVRSMLSRMREVISDEYSSSDFSTLSMLGITTQMDGTLEIDNTKLEKALEDDFDAVSKLFIGDETGDGMMTDMLTVLDDYHKNGGLYAQRIDQLEYRNEDIQEEREELDARMEAKAESLREYYARMDSQIAQMNQTQNMMLSMLM